MTTLIKRGGIIAVDTNITSGDYLTPGLKHARGLGNPRSLIVSSGPTNWLRAVARGLSRVLDDATGAASLESASAYGPQTEGGCEMGFAIDELAHSIWMITASGRVFDLRNYRDPFFALGSGWSVATSLMTAHPGLDAIGAVQATSFMTTGASTPVVSYRVILDENAAPQWQVRLHDETGRVVMTDALFSPEGPVADHASDDAMARILNERSASLLTCIMSRSIVPPSLRDDANFESVRRYSDHEVLNGK